MASVQFYSRDHACSALKLNLHSISYSSSESSPIVPGRFTVEPCQKSNRFLRTSLDTDGTSPEGLRNAVTSTRVHGLGPSTSTSESLSNGQCDHLATTVSNREVSAAVVEFDRSTRTQLPQISLQPLCNGRDPTGSCDEPDVQRSGETDIDDNSSVSCPDDSTDELDASSDPDAGSVDCSNVTARSTLPSRNSRAGFPAARSGNSRRVQNVRRDVVLPRVIYGRPRRLVLPQSTDIPLAAVTMRGDVQFIDQLSRHVVKQSSIFSHSFHFRLRLADRSLPSTHSEKRVVEDACAVGGLYVIGYRDCKTQVSIVTQDKVCEPRP